MSEAVIRMRGVRKRYGRTEALAGVDLEVARGEFVGLAGVNGAGKTTLIKCLLDFLAVDAGAIEIFGVRHREPRARARLAFLPERFVPPYYLTGEDFLRYLLSLSGETYRERAAREMLAALDLEPDALARPVRSYSKGMTQKLGLAGTFLSRRDLYVLDEPMSGLDPKARALVKGQLAGLRAAGATLLFTSHALADVEEVCDRMVVLHRGVRYFSGTPRSLCEHYAERSIEQAFLHCIEGPGHDRHNDNAEPHAADRR
ncbi:MAG: ABC transporter ATP-binding protein [Burkholderiales bacterium]|nr:ABC transporter ATP-binding protein [Burkholderiales bacterium]